MKPAKASRSNCEPFREQILPKLELGLSAQRIYQDLVEEHGFAAKYHSVRRLVVKLNQVKPLPFRRIEVAPGEEAQIDFGKGQPIFDAEGTRRRTHVLRVVLSHSRKGCSEAVFRQTTESFIRCIENALRHFGGVPKALVPDKINQTNRRHDQQKTQTNRRHRPTEDTDQQKAPTKDTTNKRHSPEKKDTVQRKKTRTRRMHRGGRHRPC